MAGFVGGIAPIVQQQQQSSPTSASRVSTLGLMGIPARYNVTMTATLEVAPSPASAICAASTEVRGVVEVTPSVAASRATGLVITLVIAAAAESEATPVYGIGGQDGASINDFMGNPGEGLWIV